MLELIAVAALAAGLAGASTFAAGRWGYEIGGVLSTFPLIVGPVLLVAAHRQGTAFASHAAAATLLGLVALSGFALAYGRSAVLGGWQVSLALLGGMVAFATFCALVALLVDQAGMALAFGLAMAAAALVQAAVARPARTA